MASKVIVQSIQTAKLVLLLIIICLIFLLMTHRKFWNTAMTPHMSSHDEGKKLQKGDRGRGPSRRPGSGKPSGTPNCPKTMHGPSSIGRHKQVWEWGDGRHAEKTNSIPGREELTPPGQIATKFEIEANRVGWGPKRPGGIILQTCWREPMSDSNSFRVHHRFVDDARSRSIVAANLWGGRRATWATESSSMPKNTSVEEGPLHLPGWRGRQSWWNTDRAIVTLVAHSEEFAGARVRKSSR